MELEVIMLSEGNIACLQSRLKNKIMRHHGKRAGVSQGVTVKGKMGVKIVTKVNILQVHYICMQIAQ
jgi:hypothetical protein